MPLIHEDDDAVWVVLVVVAVVAIVLFAAIYAEPVKPSVGAFPFPTARLSEVRR